MTHSTVLSIFSLNIAFKGHNVIVNIVMWCSFISARGEIENSTQVNPLAWGHIYWGQPEVKKSRDFGWVVRAGQRGYKKVGISQSSSLVQNNLNNPDMKTSVVLGLALLLLAMASLTDAGCNQFGCCYCHNRQGVVVNQVAHCCIIFLIWVITNNNYQPGGIFYGLRPWLLLQMCLQHQKEKILWKLQ